MNNAALVTVPQPMKARFAASDLKVWYKVRLPGGLVIGYSCHLHRGTIHVHGPHSFDRPVLKARQLLLKMAVPIRNQRNILAAVAI